MSITYTVFTDGSASQGQGGVGIVLYSWEKREAFFYSYRVTLPSCTNNQAELLAVYQALWLTRGHHIRLYTDSQYVQKSLSLWILRWEQNNFKGIKNVPLLQACRQLEAGRQVEYLHVRAHQRDGSPETYYNNWADHLANCGRLSS